MNKRPHRKLLLNRETVRRLDPEETAQARGAFTTFVCTIISSVATISAISEMTKHTKDVCTDKCGDFPTSSGGESVVAAM